VTEHALAELVAERRAAGEGYLAIRVCYDLGQVQHAQGRLGAALRTYRQGLQIASGAGQQPPFAGMAHVGLAEVLYERGELAADCRGSGPRSAAAQRAMGRAGSSGTAGDEASGSGVVETRRPVVGRGRPRLAGLTVMRGSR
jgi:hypothetical protein